MVVGIAHVCFTSKNLDASIAFYCDVLGLKQSFEFINDEGKRFGVYIAAGGRSFIELFEGQYQEAPDVNSYRHICLEVEDLPGLVSRLRAQGVEVTDPFLAMDQTWQAWLSDPDGNRIELHAYTSKSWQVPFLNE
mgnify:CR=1 FL=1